MIPAACSGLSAWPWAYDVGTKEAGSTATRARIGFQLVKECPQTSNKATQRLF